MNYPTVTDRRAVTRPDRRAIRRSDRRASRRADRRGAIRSVTVAHHRIDLLQQDQLGRAVAAALDRQRAPLLLASANLDHVYRFAQDPDLFTSSESGQWLVLLDGVPLVWACRRMTGRDWDKLAGSDVLPDLLALAEAQQARVGFLGGVDESRGPLARAIARRWPDLNVTGHWTPPREIVEDRAASSVLASVIADTATDLLVVGLGKPRQEQWMARHAAEAGARVTAAFGASADFIAGTRKRAPEALRRVGAEWLYRLLREPRRLGVRYLAEGPVAFARVAREVHAAALQTGRDDDVVDGRSLTGWSRMQGYALRHLPGPVPSGRPEPHPRPAP